MTGRTRQPQSQSQTAGQAAGPTVPTRTTRAIRLPRRHRSGVTLLEILIATVVLLVALGALGTQTGVAVRAASRVELESIGSILCESLADELIATQQVAEQLRPKQMSYHPNWRYTVDLQESDESNHVAWVTVTVWHESKPLESRTSFTQLVRIRSGREIGVANFAGSNGV